MIAVDVKDYFRDRPDRVFELQCACESWAGTPFRERSMVRGEGGGVDCAGFVGASFAQCGAVPRAVSVPPYEVNHAQHSEESVLRAWLEQPAVRRHVRRVEHDEPHLDGDMVFPKVGRTEHHLAIRIGRMIYHIARPSGWCVMCVAQFNFHPSRYRVIEA
jgi:cell wall-associated NlpC family hydrolase